MNKRKGDNVHRTDQEQIQGHLQELFGNTTLGANVHNIFQELIHQEVTFTKSSRNRCMKKWEYQECTHTLWVQFEDFHVLLASLL